MNKTQTPRQVLNLPAGYFGMVLGTIGMGFAWRYASTLWPVSRSIGDGLVTLAMAMWVLLRKRPRLSAMRSLFLA
ncbi:hypothetical protein ACLBQW_30855, partial [Klebsiella pneumoniae]